MKAAPLLSFFFLGSLCIHAHVISMSSGYATVSATRVDYILRMPDYELQKGLQPLILLDRIHFTSGFETARRTDGECHKDSRQSLYLCAATYVFSKPVNDPTVECEFFEVTAANHIHMLHAERGGKSDRAILDSAFSSATLRFRPPAAAEIAATAMAGAARRTFTTWAQLLLLAALAFAARNFKELLWAAASFLCGEGAAFLAGRRFLWQLSPGFTESVVALSLAYFAFEMLMFPRSTLRWGLGLLFGGFCGLYYASFAADSGYPAEWVLAGACLSGLLVLLTAVPAWKLGSRSPALQRGVAFVLIAAGCSWFAFRLRG